MSKSDVAAMQRFKVGELTVDAGTPILMQGSNSPQVYTAMRGMGLRTKVLENGRRQVLSIIFPGDLIGLQAALLGEMGHSIEATTKMTLCVFDRSGLYSFFGEHPERAYDLTWIAAVEEHFLGETVATLGQRSALESVAWAFHKIFARGLALNLVHNNTMPFPFKQQDLADALGLSLVHTNKTLKKLRENQIASWTAGQLTVSDAKALEEIGLISDGHLMPRPLF